VAYDRKPTWWAAGLAVAAVFISSGATAAPPADSAPLSERIAAADARERAREAATVAAPSAPGAPRGNVIFLHPDGSGTAMWQAGRTYWKGPDDNLFWDRLPYFAFYRGHSNDAQLPPASRGLVSSSNSGATTHAFGFKVQVPDSFGQDGARPILSLSNYPGSILREAANRGHPVGVVNDGDLPEPGTGAFLAEVGNRGQGGDILDQMLFGRLGQTDRPPVVLLGGGEGFALPADAPPCAPGVIADTCFLHRDPVSGAGPERTDGRNLIVEAKAKGYVVIRTRGEFDAVLTQVKARPRYAPQVLGLFARDDLFNDVPEERLIALNLVKSGVPSADKRGRLILYGGPAGTPSFNPPTAAEMAELALLILDRRAERSGKPFMLVAEVEGTDNFGNNDNAIGSLVSLKNADDLIAVARMYQERKPRTLILTAADGDAGNMTLISSAPPFGGIDSATGNTTTVSYNPTGDAAQNIAIPVDGNEGRFSRAFQASPDDFGTVYPFSIGWIGTNDQYAAIVSRAQGLNAELLQTEFSARFDNTDVYRMAYLTLFGRFLPAAYGRLAPTRP
jgi:alkaline phosphatase